MSSVNKCINKKNQVLCALVLPCDRICICFSFITLKLYICQHYTKFVFCKYFVLLKSCHEKVLMGPCLIFVDESIDI